MRLCFYNLVAFRFSRRPTSCSTPTVYFLRRACSTYPLGNELDIPGSDSQGSFLGLSETTLAALLLLIIISYGWFDRSGRPSGFVVDGGESDMERVRFDRRAGI